MSIKKEEVNEESFGRGRDSTEISSAVSYHFSSERITRYIDTVGLEYDGDTTGEDTYGIYFQRRSRRDRSFDYYLRLRKERGESFGDLTVSYKFGERFRARSSNYKSRDGSKTYGYDISTAVNFGAPEDKIYYSEYMGDSNIRGIVYRDYNNNGKIDPGEGGVESFEISRGREKWSTDDKGRFFIPMISSGSSHTFKVKSLNEEILNYAYESEYTIKTLPGGDMEIKIPIVPMKSLVGILEFSEDFYLEEIREVLENLQGEIYSHSSQEIKEVVDIRDEYFIRELPVGTYTINLSYRGRRGSVEESFTFEVEVNEDELEEYLDIRVLREEEGYRFEFM